MSTAAEQTIPVFLAAPPPPFTFGLGVGTFENIFTYYLSVHKALSSRTFITLLIWGVVALRKSVHRCRHPGALDAEMGLETCWVLEEAKPQSRV